MNFSVVASNNHIIVDEPLAIFQPLYIGHDHAGSDKIGVNKYYCS